MNEILKQNSPWNCSFLPGSHIISSVVEHFLCITKIIEKKATLNFSLSRRTLILSLRQTFALACVKQLTTTLICIIRQLFDSRVATIRIFLQESLTQMNRLSLEVFIFYSIFNSITNTNFCFETSKIVEHKHAKKNSFIIRF